MPSRRTAGAHINGDNCPSLTQALQDSQLNSLGVVSTKMLTNKNLIYGNALAICMWFPVVLSSYKA